MKEEFQDELGDRSDESAAVSRPLHDTETAAAEETSSENISSTTQEQADEQGQQSSLTEEEEEEKPRGTEQQDSMTIKAPQVGPAGQHDAATTSAAAAASLALEHQPAPKKTAAPARIPRKVHSDDAVARHSNGNSNNNSNNNKSSPTAAARKNSPLRHSAPRVVHRKNTANNNRVRFGALSEDDENDTQEDRVDLLSLAAHRSHGIYRDTDSSFDESEQQQHETRHAARAARTPQQHHHHGSLLQSTHDNLREEKLRHLNGRTPPASNSTAPPLSDADAKAKAQARATASNTGRQSNQTSSSDDNRSNHGNGVATSIRSAEEVVVPGAYQGAPGRSFVRTEQFHHGVLQQPMLEENPSVRSSATAMTVNIDSNMSYYTATTAAGSMDYTTTAGSGSACEEVISAVRVDEDDLELHIRDEITREATQAEVVDWEKETASLVEDKVRMVRKRYIWCSAVLLLLLAGTMTAMVMGIRKLKQAEEENIELSSSYPSLSTLEAIRQRGYLICGASSRDETAMFDDAYLEGGEAFTQDICKAIAAAALGGHQNISAVRVSETERWTALHNGTIDLLMVGTPGVMKSLHWNVDPTIPVTFSTPYFFDGVGTGGKPAYVTNCANQSGYVNFMACQDLMVCVVQGSQAFEGAIGRLHPSQIVAASSQKDLYKKFAAGCCNVIATDYSNDRSEMLLREASNYTGPYALGSGLYSFQPYAVATRKLMWAYDGNRTDNEMKNDPQVFSEFVNWVINTLIAAEELNITQSTAYRFRQTDAFGEEYRNMFRDAIAAVGNYGELYARTRQSTVPRVGMNMLNDGTTGLHYARSIGDVADYGPDPYENGTINTVRDRGKLICGIPYPLNYTSFNLTTGEMEPVLYENAKILLEKGTDPMYLDTIVGTANIDFNYCRALASSVFFGQKKVNAESCSVASFEVTPDPELPLLKIVLLKSQADGYQKLVNGEVDVIAGYRKDLRGDVREPTTDHGFTYSQPYLYGPTLTGHVTDANRCLVTRQHDHQWSDFAQSVVLALFYAEENRCTQIRANEMPVVNRFGPSYKRLFRDAVFAVGNYAEVYDRSVEPELPREGGPNMLNSESDPQFASMPGLF